MNNLVLYHLDSCPFCKKVRNYLALVGMEIPKKDISRDSVKRELLKKTGTTQVPCLIIDDEPLLESDEIIRWFEVTFNLTGEYY